MTEREGHLLHSMTETTWRFYLWVAVLVTVLLWGLFAYIHQLRYGLGVTGLRDQISWGLYITNFVFFIGISHAGTLISAILRVTHAQWRREITRLAEGITVFALCIGAPMVIIDLGRPDRMWNLFRYGRIQSPILWDVLSVSTYLTGCILYFYIPMIPDLALLAKQPEISGWRRSLYKTLSLGWTGAPGQWRLLERSISTMAIIIIPLAISVHTVVSWIFSMTLRPGWNTPLFGPYFVTGAIYSGIGMVILCMFFLRRIYHLESFILPLHFRNLGLLLLTLSLIFLYFNINEYMTIGYKVPGHEKHLLDNLFFGEFSPYFKTMLVLTTLLPSLLLISILALKSLQHFTIQGTVLASLFVVVGAWLERYTIVVPTLSTPLLPMQGLPQQWTRYTPTWVEWSITAAAFAGFLLIYTLLTKVFPMVSIWETREGAPEHAVAEAAVAPAPPTPARWQHEYPFAVLLVTLVAAASVQTAQANPSAAENPKPTTLVLEWRPAPAEIPPAAAGTEESAKTPPTYLFLERVYYQINQFFALAGAEEAKKEEPSPQPVAAIANLRDSDGNPIAFQPVEFYFQTLFGKLTLGKRPTNMEGRTELIIRDRRYGNGPIQVAYAGNDTHAPAQGEILVDFGSRPAPALPEAGVLITPYATAAITLPFLAFYGFMWVMFAYAFGYLVLWRLRRLAKSEPAPAPSEPRV